MFFDPPPNTKYKNTKIRPWRTPMKTFFPWDHAQVIERKILFRIALTRDLYDEIQPYFCSKHFSIFVTFDPPSTVPKIRPLGSFGSTSRRKGKLKLDRFVLNSDTNRTNRNFPFLRPVHQKACLESRDKWPRPIFVFHSSCMFFVCCFMLVFIY